MQEAYPRGEHLKGVGYSLTHKLYTMLRGPLMDKHSSLFGIFLDRKNIRFQIRRVRFIKIEKIIIFWQMH